MVDDGWSLEIKKKRKIKSGNSYNGETVRKWENAWSKKKILPEKHVNSNQFFHWLSGIKIRRKVYT